MNRIGVFVGSFNPVHKGHVRIINYLINNNYVDKVLVIPTASYWDKKVICVNDRIAMLESYETDNIVIEKELNSIKYTYEIMDILIKRYPNTELSLILGADNIVNFAKWVNYQKLLEYRLIIIKRKDIDIKYYLDNLGKFNNYVIIDGILDISSTEVRKLIKDKKRINSYIDSKVYDYIIKNNLYG